MSTFIANNGSDQIDDFQTTENRICSSCGCEFSQGKYLRNHVKLCQDIENPADGLDVGIVPVKNEDCPNELSRSLEFDEHAAIKETSDVKVEEITFTEYTVSALNCKVSDPPMEQLEELCEYSDCGNKAQSTEVRNVRNVCDFVATKPGHLKAHIRRHAMGKQHKSNTSDVSSMNLLSRKTLTRKSAENKRLKCSRCDYASAVRDNLIRHMRSHTGQKPFKCTLCDYTSAQGAHLTRHMRTHTGDKPFKCTVCDYACAKSSNFTRHMRTHRRESI